MFRTHRSEVAAIQGNHDLSPETLGQRNHRGIRSAQGKIGVLLDELADPPSILSERGLNIERFKPTQKASFDRETSALLNQVGGFDDAERRDHEVKPWHA